MSRINHTGRSKSVRRFVLLDHWVLETPAWKSLTPAERCVYVAVRQCYNGSNNGTIGLGARRAAELAGISKNTACKCFAVLIDRGFIECATPGGFRTNSRRQTEWRLTDERCDLRGTKGDRSYARWKPGSCKTSSQSRDTKVPIEGQSGGREGQSVPGPIPKSDRRAA